MGKRAKRPRLPDHRVVAQLQHPHHVVGSSECHHLGADQLRFGADCRASGAAPPSWWRSVTSPSFTAMGAAATSDLLVVNATVLTMDAGRRILSDGYVAVCAGVITAVEQGPPPAELVAAT